MSAAALVVTFIALVALRVPIAFALGLATLGYLLVFEPGVGVSTLPQQMFAAANNFSLTAIPFFVLVGEIMNTGGISQRLVDLAKALVGHLRGGMGIVELVASMFFASFSGSAVANSAGTGAITIPAMIRSKYPRGLAAAIETSSSSLGAVIPPSIPMVVYGGIANVSIGALFVAGYVPAFIMASGLAVVVYLRATALGLGTAARTTWRGRLAATRSALAALATPILIMGGILGGVMTPTEAGAVGAVWAFAVAMFVYRELRWADMPGVLTRTAITTGVVMFVMAAANAFGWLLAFEQIPTMLTETLLANVGDATVTLLAIIVVLAIIGTVIDTIAALVILTPVLVPVAQGVGIDPLHLGVVVTIGLSLGVATPPVGVCLFVTAEIAKTTIEDVSRAIIPFLIVLFGTLALLALLPDLVLALPRAFGF